MKWKFFHWGFWQAFNVEISIWRKKKDFFFHISFNSIIVCREILIKKFLLKKFVLCICIGILHESNLSAELFSKKFPKECRNIYAIFNSEVINSIIVFEYAFIDVIINTLYLHIQIRFHWKNLKKLL